MTKIITSVLIKNKENDNNGKIEKSIFDFENLNQISLDEYLSNLKRIISDNSYREKEEEPYIQTINLPQQYILPPKLDLIEYKNITKNINSILEIKKPVIINAELQKFMKILNNKKEKKYIST